MNKKKFGCRLVSFLITVTLILNWQNVVIPIQVVMSQSSDGWSDLLEIIGILFLILNVIAAVGMFFLKRWGFAATYVAIIYSNIFFSTSYIPFVSKILRLPWSGISLLIVNLLVMIYVVYLQIS